METLCDLNSKAISDMFFAIFPTHGTRICAAHTGVLQHERGFQGFEGSESLERVLLQALLHEADAEVSGIRRVILGLGFLDKLNHLTLKLMLKWKISHNHLIADNPQSPYINLLMIVITDQHLRSLIVKGPYIG